IGHQRHQREQSKQDRGRSRNRQVTPLALCFNPEMRASLFEGDFHSPAPNEPTQNLPRRMIKISRKQGLWFKLSRGVSNQYPPDGARRIPAAIPDGGLGIDLDFTFLPAVPVVDLDLRPFRLAIVEYLLGRRAAR